MLDGDFQYLVVSLQCKIKDSVGGGAASVSTAARAARRAPILTLDSVEAVDAFNIELEDVATQGRTINVLVRSVGGSTIKHLAKGMVNRIMTNKCQGMFSLKGKKGKRNFQETKLCQTIVEAVRRSIAVHGILVENKEGTTDAIEYAIGEQIKYGNFRKST